MLYTKYHDARPSRLLFKKLREHTVFDHYFLPVEMMFTVTSLAHETRCVWVVGGACDLCPDAVCATVRVLLCQVHVYLWCHICVAVMFAASPSGPSI